MSFGSSPYGSSPYGAPGPLFGLQEVKALNPSTLLVTFTTDIALDSNTFATSNYQVTVVTAPTPLQVIKVLPGFGPNQVRLITSEQDYYKYKLTVTLVAGFFGETLDSLADEAEFTGWPKDSRFTARAVSAKTVNVLFAQQMASTPVILSAASYSITDFFGNVVPIISVSPNNPSNILRMRLDLSGSLNPGQHYVLRIAPEIETQDGRRVSPTETLLYWAQPKNRVGIPLSSFRGEVRAPVVLNRSLSEFLTLNESLSAIVQTHDPRNSAFLTEEVFDQYTNAQDLATQTSGEPLPVDNSTITSTFNARLRTSLQPFDPQEPPYVHRFQFFFREQVTVSWAWAGNDDDQPLNPPFPPSGSQPVRTHHVHVADTLTLDEFGRGERPLVQGAIAEALRLNESVKVFPEPNVGMLADSTVGLFGQPNGQVFFSPALIPGLAMPSSIQVDDVKVCTKAYDVYKPPVDVDPIPLYTHGGGLVPSLAGSTLSPSVVLFTNFYRLGGAKTIVRAKQAERVQRPVDIGADITLRQIYDPARFSLLNSTGWHLFDNSPLPFVVADNLNPVGPSQVIGNRRNFANPAEDFQLMVLTTMVTAHLVQVSESMTQGVDEVNFPGVNTYHAAVNETLTQTAGNVVLP